MRIRKALIALSCAAVFAMAVPVAAVEDFTAEMVDGSMFSLSEELKTHNFVFIEAFATWCGYCQDGAGALEEAYRAYSDDVQVVALSIDPDEEMEDIMNFAISSGWTFPVGSMRGTTLVNQLGVLDIPAYFLISKDGEVVFSQVGTLGDASAYMELFESHGAKRNDGGSSQASEDVPLNTDTYTRTDAEPAQQAQQQTLQEQSQDNNQNAYNPTVPEEYKDALSFDGLTSLEVCEVSGIMNQAEGGFLALRTAPSYDDANIIAEYHNGDVLYRSDKVYGDYVVAYDKKSGKTGFVNKNYLKGSGTVYNRDGQVVQQSSGDSQQQQDQGRGHQEQSYDYSSEFSWDDDFIDVNGEVW